MSVARWISGAPAVAQVVYATPAGTIEAGDKFTFQIGNKALTIASTSTTIASIVTQLVSAWNASTEPEFSEVTATASGSSAIALTADVAGKPFTVSTTTVEADGSTSDSQTFTTTTAGTSNDGPNVWSTPANWDINTVPVSSDDVYVENSAQGIWYGLNTSTVVLESLNIGQNYTGTVGLPERNSGGYAEYRETHLNISTKVLRIGYGSGGNGSERLKINLGSTQASKTEVNIYNSGKPAETGLEAILLRGTNSSNTLQVLKGSVGIAVVGGSTSNFAAGVNIGYTDNKASDSKVRFGAGCTLGVVNIRGGEVITNSAITTLTMTDGKLTHQAGGMTTFSLEGGTCNYNSTGTVAVMLLGSKGTLDLTKDMRAVTFTTFDMWAGATLRDSFKRGVYSNLIDINHAGIQNVTIDIGTDIRISVGTPL